MNWHNIAKDYMVKAVAAEGAYREAKAEFDAVTEAYRAMARSKGGDAFNIADAETKAASDQRRITANGKAVFMNQEAQMYVALARMAFAAEEFNTRPQRYGGI